MYGYQLRSEFEQRTATMASLQDYTRLKRAGRAANPTEPADMAWSLVLDSLVFAAEAEIRWLDHCVARLRRAALEAGTGLEKLAGRAPQPADAARNQEPVR